MPIIPAGAIVAFLAVAFVIAAIWIGIRMARESGEQAEARKAADAEIARRANAKGRRFEKISDIARSREHRPMPAGVVTLREYNPLPQSDAIWKQQGSAAGNIDWTLVWAVSYKASPFTATNEPTVYMRDVIQGQRLEWRCPALKHDGLAFSFYRRHGDDTKPDEIRIEPEGTLWRRWRLEARDEALARRVFNPALCALLDKLPTPRASNTLIDERTSIMLDANGLQAILGVDDLTPDLVDLWIAVGEQLAAEAKA